MSANKLQDVFESARLRREHNQDLIRRMRNGESLTSFDSQSSWFPPRPTIEKDDQAISRLYGEKAVDRETEKTTRNVQSIRLIDP